MHDKWPPIVYLKKMSGVQCGIFIYFPSLNKRVSVKVKKIDINMRLQKVLIISSEISLKLYSKCCRLLNFNDLFFTNIPSLVVLRFILHFRVSGVLLCFPYYLLLSCTWDSSSPCATSCMRLSIKIPLFRFTAEVKPLSNCLDRV